MAKILVSDEHRLNSLSLIPGGSVVKIVHSNNKQLIYDKIKNPSAYIRSISNDPTIVEIWVNDELLFKK